MLTLDKAGWCTQTLAFHHCCLLVVAYNLFTEMHTSVTCCDLVLGIILLNACTPFKENYLSVTILLQMTEKNTYWACSYKRM